VNSKCGIKQPVKINCWKIHNKKNIKQNINGDLIKIIKSFFLLINKKINMINIGVAKADNLIVIANKLKQRIKIKYLFILEVFFSSKILIK